MHSRIKGEYRTLLKELLADCTEGQQMVFKRMYSHNNLELDINTVVDKMDESKYENAIVQCERTVKKNKTLKKDVNTKNV